VLPTSAPGFAVALFIVLSLFNFQAWDKYLLDVLPTTLIAIFARSEFPRVAARALGSPESAKAATKNDAALVSCGS
jgi:hypothetical protein